ncbi:DUF6884 domain-containing protein [Anaeromyxobacter dehalogenans]|nr:DUF6884 domain-containing protein [Anaeromyxobacter dehalogenans]
MYFFFEPGEERRPSAAGQRVVRVGTHAVSAGSKTTLWQRLKQHQGYGGDAGVGVGNHRGSVFRHHVGLALIRSGRSPDMAEAWMTTSPTPEMRASELPLEQLVSEYLASMRVLWIEADDTPGPNSMRAYIEAHAIALLSEAATAEPASSGWLGHHAADEAIRRSGLWNVKHVGRSFDPAFLDEFQRLVAHTPSVSLGGGRSRESAVHPVAVATPLASVPLGESANSALEQPVLALLSCTKKKAPVPCAAADLYAPSSFFRKAYALARRVARDTFILSAKHGLVHPGDVIAPYEQTLADSGRAERRAWALGVHRQLIARTEYREARTILWFAGDAYRQDLMPLVMGDGKRCVVPMERLAQGEQLAWLTRNEQVRTEALPLPRRVAGPATGSPVVNRALEKPVVEKPARMMARPTAAAAPKAAAFEQELGERLARARRDSKKSLVVNAGELHRSVGGYPGPGNRMPICCRVMRKYMSAGDRIVAAPPRGDGASFTVCYELT